MRNTSARLNDTTNRLKPDRYTDFRAGKGVSRKENGGKEAHGCSDTDFRAGKGVSRKEKRQEMV